MSSPCAVIVLAAGLSSRMGGKNKLLLPLGNAALVAQTVKNSIKADVGPVLVVTGHEKESVVAALDGCNVEFIHNAAFSQGMASSLACGVSSLPAGVSRCMIMLGDMPLIGAELMRKIVAAADEFIDAPAIVPVCGGEWAHPVLLRGSLFPAIQSLKGDVGARRILKAHAGVVTIPVDDEATLMDADTPEAYEKIRIAFQVSCHSAHG